MDDLVNEIIEVIEKRMTPEEIAEAEAVGDAVESFTIQVLRIADKYGRDRNELMKKVLICLLQANDISDFNAFEI